MLSKSQYVRGLQCDKSLWLQKNHPELKTPPDPALEARFRAGHVVGECAKQLFPGGVEIPFDRADFDGMARRTQELIDQGASVIYEATFVDPDRGLFAMADILKRNADGHSWDVYEVKASTKVKPYHLDDAAFQWHLISTRLELDRAYVVRVDNTYERQGALDAEQLLAAEDVTAEVAARLPEIQARVDALQAMIDADQPAIDIGPHCSDPFDCDFKAHCWSHIPSPSVFDLHRLSAKKKFSLYLAGMLRFDQLPADTGLNTIQQLQVQCASSGQPSVDTGYLSDFLGRLEYPLSFFDFETFMEPVPRFDAQRPYEALPFQYSLHILNADGRLEHREFLADPAMDPRPEAAERMLADLPDNGSIVAYNVSFEKARIRELAARCPMYADGLQALLPRFVDLIEPFRDGAYYHPGFGGSFSIKSVLPALIPDDPDLSYQALRISDGAMAMDAFASLNEVTDPDEVQVIRRDLINYCRLDTLAMVKIVEHLQIVANGA